MLSLAPTFLALALQNHGASLPGRPIRHSGGWCVDAPVIAGGVGDVDGDGCDDYAVLRSGAPIQVRSGANDRPVERSTEELARALDPVCERRFRAEQDPALVGSERYRAQFERAPSDKREMRDVIPLNAAGRVASQRVLGIGGHWTWFDLESNAARAEFDAPPCARVQFAYVARIDADAAEDLLVICDGMGVDPNDDQTACSAVIAFDGASGRERWRRELFGRAPYFAYTVCGEPNLVSPGDVDGDGEPDFVLAHVTSVFDQGPSILLALSGRSGEVIWRQSRNSSFGETLGSTVALVSDRDGDGLRDVVFARGHSSDEEDDVFGVVSSKTGAILSTWKP